MHKKLIAHKKPGAPEFNLEVCAGCKSSPDATEGLPPPPTLLSNSVLSSAFSDSEIIVLLGENGTGKTTFIRMLAGLLKADPAQVSRQSAHIRISVGRPCKGIRA